MGVPGLFPFLCSLCPNAINSFSQGTKNFFFDYLFIDSNGLLHTSAQKIFNYGEGKKILDPYAKYSYKEKINLLYEDFFNSILDVTNVVIPQKILYIAIDGPAPRAKLVQQRERRFVAAKTKTNNDFDSACITPGTEFIHNLSKYMYKKIKNHNWKNIKVIFSPPSVPGEGEHKIMDHIRLMNDGSFCMFGPDGDLLILTLSSHKKNMHLLRQDQYNTGFFNMIDMEKIRLSLTKEMGHDVLIEKNIRCRDDICNDFTFISFFVGNDFLPKIKMFFKLDKGLEKMFNLYKTISSNELFLTHKKYINIQSFITFIEKLVLTEEQCLLDQGTTFCENKILIDYTLKKYIVNGKLDMKGYRKAYYEKAGITSKIEVADMCINYIQTLLWVYLYYIDGLPSWSHTYKYHYAPLLCDLHYVLSNLGKVDMITQLGENKYLYVNFDMDKPALPFEQLLSILPPSSINLLADEYKILFDDQGLIAKGGCHPKNFDIDYEGKRYAFQGTALLPFINFNFIRKVYNEHTEKLSVAYHRNTFGKNYIFEK